MLSFICRNNKIEPCDFKEPKEIVYEYEVGKYTSIDPYTMPNMRPNLYVCNYVNYMLFNGEHCVYSLYLKEGDYIQNWMHEYIDRNFFQKKCVDCCKFGFYKLNKDNLCEICENIREFDKFNKGMI